MLTFVVCAGGGRAEAVEVSAPCSHTPVSYLLKAAGGFHYCKLLSPARAMEWLYTDGLRNHTADTD